MQPTSSRPQHSVAVAWREAVRLEGLAELDCRPTRPHRQRRDRLARQLLLEGERIWREMLP